MKHKSISKTVDVLPHLTPLEREVLFITERHQLQSEERAKYWIERMEKDLNLKTKLK